MRKILATLSLIAGVFADQPNPIAVVKVPPTKFNSHASLKIISPQVLKKNAPVVILVSNFPIGVDLESRPLEDKGVKKYKAGSRVLLMFSNGRRVYVTKDDVNLLLTQRAYFNKRFRVKVPHSIYKSIEDNNFVMYSMLVNCYGEAIKSDSAFYTDVYSYVDEKKGIRSFKKHLKSPFVIYNEPFGKVGKSGVLLDFYVRNAIISPDEYKIDLYIDGKKVARLVRWNPYVIENLSKGKHDVRIELIDPTGKIIKNPVSVNSSTIYVK